MNASRLPNPLILASVAAALLAAAVAEPQETPAPQPLSASIAKGIDWLVEHQLPNGGFGQGEESGAMNHGANDVLPDQANVADTCIAILALLRAGSTPADGPFAEAQRRAVEFVLGEIEAADADSLAITSIQGTRVQSKLGPFIDTFLASVALAELDGRMPDAASRARLTAALGKVLHKIQANQKEDGTWDGRGWAPALSQVMATKGLNRARQAGYDVPSVVLDRAAKVAQQAVDAGTALASEGSAGVELYAGASNLGSLQENWLTFKKREGELRDQAANAPSPEAREDAQREIDNYEEAGKDLEQVRQEIVGRLEDEQFVAGFGSNGGEEFLSYLQIGESLMHEGGDAWSDWSGSMAANLNRVQNADGSWSGHHCITGRTFCTSAALLVLMLDRAPTPEEAAPVSRAF